MIIHDVKQNTPEWSALRAGKFTASTFPKLFMKPDTKGYNEAINRVVFERLTGEIPEGFSNEWTDRGHELEPLALAEYEKLNLERVQRVGFIELSEWVGCSPDGLIGDEGLVQVKCPKFSTLIDAVLDDVIPKDYMIQMQGELLVSGRQWNDYFVFHPKLRPIQKRVERDEVVIGQINKQLIIAIAEVQTRINKIRGRNGQA